MSDSSSNPNSDKLDPEVTDPQSVPSPDLETDGHEPMEEAKPERTWLTEVVALLPIAICFMGSGRNPWVLGIAAFAIGALLLTIPAKGKIPYPLQLVLGSIALLTVLPLLPVPMPFPPAWRVHLVRDIDIPLGRTWSPQPFITFEIWVRFVMIMLWFVWLVGQPQLAESRAHIIRRLCAGISILATISLVLSAIGWKPPGWGYATSGFQLGPFANRTHFSTLMAMNGVLCLSSAYDLLRRRKREWFIFALCLVPSFAVVLNNTSRAGLALFFAGLALWFGAAALRKRSMKRLAIGGALLLALTAAAVLFGQQLLARFSRIDDSVIETLSSDGRVSLYLDTLNLILQHPVLGVGLGNFNAVFGQTNQLHQAFVAFRHPESDLLWFAAEAGWPATVAALLGVILFIRWIGPWRSRSKSNQRRERRLRLAAGFAVILCLVHALIETPMRDLPMSMILALLGSLALYHNRLDSTRGAARTGLLKLGGVFCVAASGLWLLAGLGMPSLMGDSIASQNLEIAATASSAQTLPAAERAIDRVISVAPLNWMGWFQKASIGIRSGHSQSEVMQNFGRARYLQPNLVDMCMTEADIWLTRDPMHAIPAWREALRRESTLSEMRFRYMLDCVKQYPELRESVRELSRSDARLMNLYLEKARNAAEFNEVLQDMISRFPQLEGLSHYQRSLFFTNWRRQGDRKALMTALQSHPSWLDDGWHVLAAELGDSGKPQEAYELALKHVTPPMNLSVDPSYSLDQLQREFTFNPSDARRGFNLALLQRERRQFNESLSTLDKIAQQPNAPRAVQYEKAKVYAAMADFVKAWEMMSRYLQL